MGQQEGLTLPPTWNIPYRRNPFFTGREDILTRLYDTFTSGKTAALTMYDEVIVPDGKLWKRFGPIHVYAPAREYILALKIAAGRKKDLDDCAILLPKTKIRKIQRYARQKEISLYGA